MLRVLQGLWIAGGAGLALWALRAPALRDADGFLDPLACLALACATTGVALGAAWGSRLRPAAAWGALAGVGQAAMLQLIDAGRAIHYEHWSPPYVGASPFEAALLVGLALQAVVVARALASRRNEFAPWLRTHVGWLRGAVGVGLFVMLSAFPSRELDRFALEVLLSSAARAVQLGCVLLAVLSLPADVLAAVGARVDRLLSRAPGSSPAPHRVDPVAGTVAVWVFAVALLLAVVSYDRHPHIPDEVAYLWQARTFAAGRIETPAPPVPEAFEVYLLDCEGGRCISPFPPGWPALLSLGEHAGLPWAVNPLLAGLNVLLAFWLLQELYDRGTARLGALLLAVSPWQLFMAMNLMSHTSSLTFALLAAGSVARMRADPRLRWGVLGGVGIGAVSLIRPLEGVMVAAVLGLAALGIRGRRFRLAPVLTLGLASAAFGSLVLPYNQAITGSATTFPVMEYMEKVWGPGTNTLGFGPEKSVTWNGLDPFPGHGLRDVIVNADLNTVGLNVELFGWSVGSLLPLALLLLCGRPRGPDGWMALAVAVVVGTQSLYWFSGGPDFGARYWFLLLLPLVALTARGLLWLADRLSTGAVAAAVALLSASAVLTYLPWRAIDKYHHYRDMRPDVREWIAQRDPGAALLLVRGESTPDLASAIVYNPLDPRAPAAISAWDRSPEVRARLLEAYPDRPVWLIDGPTLTGGAYRVVAGPLSASQLQRTPEGGVRTGGAPPGSP